MHLRAGLINGDIIQTDNVDTNVVIDEIVNQRGGKMGSGYYENVRVENIGDIIAFYEALIRHSQGNPTFKWTFVVNGEDVVYPNEDIGWIRIVP